MNEIDIQNNLNRLNEIQEIVWDWRKSGYNKIEIANLRQEFRLLARTITGSGHKMGTKSIKNANGEKIGVKWYIKSNGEKDCTKRNCQCEWVNCDMSPDHSHLKGNCTTRSLAFILKGELTYDEIEERQYQYAEIANRNDPFRRIHYHRNTHGIWDKILTEEKGYKWIVCRVHKSRANIASYLKGIERPMISHSTGHVAIIQNGKVYDKWDSRGGRVKSILVHKDDYNKVRDILTDCGIINY